MKKNFWLPVCTFALIILNQSCKKESNSFIVSAVDTINDDQREVPDNITLDSGLLCYLPFKGNLKDKSGYKNHGVLNGSISYVPDRDGNAFSAASFSASSTWIEIPEDDFVGLEKVTIGMDFYVTSTARQVLISKMSYQEPEGSPDFYQSFVLIADLGLSTPIQFGSKRLGFCDNVFDGWNPTLDTDSSFALNRWYHVAITFNNQLGKIYLNGNLVGVTSRSSSPICEGEPIRLGIWWHEDPLYFTGNMDEVRIYNRCLSGKEIKELAKK